MNTVMRSIHIGAPLVCAFAIWAAVSGATVRADDASSSGGTTAAAPVADPQCVEPDLPPRVAPAERDIKRFNKQYAEYKTCMDAYIATEKAHTKEYQDLAQAHVEAGNRAILRFNHFVEQVKDATTAAGSAPAAD